MKNVFKVLGIIALVAVIGFGLVSCGDDDDDDGSAPETKGRLTITGLDAFEGKYAGGNGFQLLKAGADINIKNSSITGGKIENGQVTLKVWKEATLNKYEGYSGNDQNQGFWVYISDTADNIVKESTNRKGRVESVDFTDGVGESEFLLNR